MLASPTAFDPVLQVGKPPSRRPAHSGALELNGRTRRMNWNLVATLIGPRTDSDVLGFGVTNNPATVAWTWREATRVSQREGIWPRRESIRQTNARKRPSAFPGYRRSNRLEMCFMLGGE